MALFKRNAITIFGRISRITLWAYAMRIGRCVCPYFKDLTSLAETTYFATAYFLPENIITKNIWRTSVELPNEEYGRTYEQGIQ